MFAHYLGLALRGFNRNRVFTALMVAIVGCGIAAAMTTWSVFRAVSGDPIPEKSARLFVPQIDNWGPEGRSDREPPIALDYTDAMALMRDRRAKRQSAMYRISPSVVPPDATRYPVTVDGHAVYAEFFPMLEVPFRHGSSWSAADDAARARVVVIGAELNRKLFGGENSVGQSLNVEGVAYRVAGVLAPWNPQPRFYDVPNAGAFNTEADEVFMPFTTAIDVALPNTGTTNCTRSPEEPGFAGLRNSSCVWIAFMAELDDAAAVSAYREYLDAWAAEQQAAGRFDWPPNNRLRDVPAWLAHLEVVPEDARVSLLVSIGLLLVCLVNTVGLLLAKFLRRSSEIGVRRALGAPRRAICLQFLIEAGVVGLAGGVLGLLLTALGMQGISWVMPEAIASLARFDWPLLGVALLLAMAGTMLAGLYPALRSAGVQPAWQLKSD